VDEDKLIKESKAGNKSALNTLLTNNYSILYGYIIKMTGDTNTAQDIVQETMLKAILNLNKFKPEAKFSTWLITIATNIYRDNLRKYKEVLDIDDSTEYASSDKYTEDTVITHLEYKRVMGILMKLPYEKRAVFILKNYYGYKYEEIAEILKCPVGTVRSRLHNCVKFIMEAFKESEA
jgi:RNA polymerase sigma-70 factor (ECF subfamily)